MFSVSPTVPVWAAVAVVIVASVAADWDVRTRTIPNRLTGPALLLGLVAHGIAGGGHGLVQGLTGAVVAGGLLLPGWLMGWMGAGDVKLMAALGAWLAYPVSVIATLASLMAGGVIALAVAVRRRALGRSLLGAARLGLWAASGSLRAGQSPVVSGLRFPFAAAILTGCFVSLWMRP